MGYSRSKFSSDCRFGPQCAICKFNLARSAVNTIVGCAIRYTLSVLVVVLIATSSLAAESVEVDPKKIAYIENYLNTSKKMQADFVQMTDDGAVIEGEISIQRPGKMRLTYRDPIKDFIVADGSFLNVWDAALKSSSTIPLGESLAWFFLRYPISLTKDATITAWQEKNKMIAVTLVQKGAPEQGRLTLYFLDQPLQFHSWVVEDGAGHKTIVSLSNLQQNVSFPAGTFVYRPPNFATRKGSPLH